MTTLQPQAHWRWHLAIWIIALTALWTPASASRRRDRIRAEDWKMVSDLAFVDDVFGDDPFGDDDASFDDVSDALSPDKHHYSDQVI